MTAQIDSLPDSLRDRWLRHEAGVQALHRRQHEAAQETADHLRRYPGYYVAAVARNEELLAMHADRPNLRWAWERWARIFRDGGVAEVLAMFADERQHQELLSSSPFYLMRPPLPENRYYQDYAPAQP